MPDKHAYFVEKLFYFLDQSWYLGADMQLHWIAPIILLPMASK